MLRHTVLRQPLHKNPIDLTLVDIEGSRLRDVLEQVVHLLVVDLQE